MLEEQKYANVIVNWRFPVQNVLKSAPATAFSKRKVQASQPDQK